MDMRRMLPLLLIAFAALFILPQLFKSSRSTSLSAKDRGALTLDAIARIDRAEQQVFSSSGKYTAHLADLVARDKVLASETTIPLTVDLDVSESGKGYVARVTSDIFSVTRARSGTALVAQSCRELRTTSGVGCPTGTTSPRTETVTTPTGTTTTTSTTGTVTTVTTK
ncbi:MAG TPA: hypothetical protein VFA66_01570 [Gaiellaceae bacterium]|nr:hypothetical protein [Gaiellaceae bacterium]